MIHLLVAVAAAALVVGYAVGQWVGKAKILGRWIQSKSRGPNGCVHNVIAEREFPKGDRLVCEDCGESDPGITDLSGGQDD